MKYDGVYIKGSINSIPITYTADTGATKTVISDRIYRQIPDKPKLHGSAHLTGAGGKPLAELGKAVFTIMLGSV